MFRLDVATLTILLVFGIPIVAIVGGYLIEALKIIRGYPLDSDKKGRGIGPANPDETRLIQELHQGFNDLEKRVESLETILLERSRSRKKEKDLV